MFFSLISHRLGATKLADRILVWYLYKDVSGAGAMVCNRMILLYFSITYVKMTLSYEKLR